MMSITATMTKQELPPSDTASSQPSRQQERDLLVAVATGDRNAAGELVERTYRRVYASLHRLSGGDIELAADLTQETYRKAWVALTGFDGRASLTTWLYRIAYNLFLNHLRRPQAVLPLAPETEQRASDPTPPHDERLARKQQWRALRRAVLDLPEELCATVAAHYWGELPVREIATLLEISQVAVRKRLRKALRMLGTTLEVTP